MFGGARGKSQWHDQVAAVRARDGISYKDALIRAGEQRRARGVMPKTEYVKKEKSITYANPIGHKRAPSAWNLHVRAVAAQNPHLKGKDLFKRASRTYDKGSKQVYLTGPQRAFFA